MKLTARLEKISSLVEPGKRIADIGTDHAYIPSYLMSKGLIDKAILTDVNKGPLDNARSEIIALGFEDKCQLRLGSGLDVVKPGEVDQIIIAGMGGVLISEILEKGKDTAKSVEKLILQPMQGQDELRRYLDMAGYRVESEHLVKEDFRIYEIIVVHHKSMDLGLVDKTKSEDMNSLGVEDTEYRDDRNYGLMELQIDPRNIIYADSGVSLTKEDKVKFLEDLRYEIPTMIFNNPKDLVEDFLDKKIHDYSSILKKIPDIDNETIDKRKNEIKFKLSLINDHKKQINTKLYDNE